jgi:hypothetical protein
LIDYSNIPCENIKENDLFGIKPKYKLISAFVKKMPTDDIYGCHKMIALYGEWGSGKSSVFNTLKCENNQNCETEVLVFDCWEIENDNNLGLSLLEFIASEADISKLKSGAISTCWNFLRSFARNTSFDFAGASINAGQIAKDLSDQDNELILDKSFYTQKKNFKDSFDEIIDNFLKKKDKKHLIVCIDELDRCQPENVLNLLASIKHFYTLNSKVAFICGVDRKAVKQALYCRYRDNVKAEEYLEKIFDISFNMPKKIRTKELVTEYLVMYRANLDINNLADEISYFLEKLEFVNPRRLKKVLNKYSTYNRLIVLDGNRSFKLNRRSMVQNIFVIYSIILHEFYPDKFNKILKIDERFANQDYGNGTFDQPNYDNYKNSIIEYVSEKNIKFDNIDDINMLLRIFSPKLNNLSPTMVFNSRNISDSLNQIELNGEGGIEFRFCKYIVKKLYGQVSEIEEYAFNIKALFETTQFLL